MKFKIFKSDYDKISSSVYDRCKVKIIEDKDTDDFLTCYSIDIEKIIRELFPYCRWHHFISSKQVCEFFGDARLAMIDDLRPRVFRTFSFYYFKTEEDALSFDFKFQ